MEEQIWKLINQKAAAQRTVFDKEAGFGEARYKNVEEVLAEAVNAQMQVAKAVIEIEREAVGPQSSAISDQPEVWSTTHNPEPTATHSKQKSHVGAAQFTRTALFQKFGAQGKRSSRRKSVTPLKQQLSLFGMLAMD